jgi:hypothetical protein
MSIDAEPAPRRPSVIHRSDRPETEPAPLLVVRWSWELPHRFLALAVLATGFILIGGGSLDPGPIEARLGMAAAEQLAPFGQVFGNWDPSIWPGQLVPSLIWSLGEEGFPSSASIRWPAAIAGVLIGLILSRRAATVYGGRTGLLVGLCWYGSIALMDRSAGAGIDLMTALATIAALDRVLSAGSGWLAGCWAAVAFLIGGWPPLAIVLVTTAILGRAGAGLGWRLLLPPTLAAVGWTWWAWSVAPVEVWAAALTLPLTKGPSWLLATGTLALGLPWTPLALLATAPTVRGSWTPKGRALTMGWLQITGVCLLAGTLIPGLAEAAKAPALAGLAVAAASACESLLRDSVQNGPRRAFFAIVLILVFLWTALTFGAGGYLAAAVPYYRFLSVTLIALAIPIAGLAVWSASHRSAPGALVAMVALALCLKMAHFGYYVPEWNYQRSQGPWGRAVGQWVPPRWPIYVTHAWRPDFAFATAHPLRQLASPQHLAFQPGEAKYALLLDAEFDNWPDNAGPLTKIATFQDEYGGTRILARTPGPLPWNWNRVALPVDRDE